jgi:hypothetical protein
MVVAIVGDMHPRYRDIYSILCLFFLFLISFLSAIFSLRNVIEAVIRHTKDIEEAVQTLLDGIHAQTWLDKDNKKQIRPEIQV